MKGFERKRKHYTSSAEECRQRGFQVGDRLTGDEGYGPTVIQLTAIGEHAILGREISHNGKPSQSSHEGMWTLSCRNWEKVPQ